MLDARTGLWPDLSGDTTINPPPRRNEARREGRSHSVRASTFMVTVVIAIAASTSSCGDDREEPLERVGAPLEISPAHDSGHTTNGTHTVRPQDASFHDEGSRSTSSSPSEAAQNVTPQPAKALTLAAEGDAIGARGELDDALALYDRAVRLNHKSPWQRVARAWYQSRTNHLSQARDDLEVAVDLVERSDPLLLAAIHHGFGELRESRRDWARARESYRTALRAWSASPLARALLRVTPPTNDQRNAAEQLAFDGQKLPPQVLNTFAKRGGATPLAATELPGRGVIVVTALPEPRTSSLAAGARYRVHIERTPQQPDAGAVQPPVKLLVGETSAVRWHQAKVRALTLGTVGAAVLVTIVRIAPGAGAPEEEWTSLVTVGAGGEPELLITRQTGEQRDDPLGCRRGWHEEVSVREKSLHVVREDFVRPRLPQASSYCTKRSKTKARESINLEQP